MPPVNLLHFWSGAHMQRCSVQFKYGSVRLIVTESQQPAWASLSLACPVLSWSRSLLANLVGVEEIHLPSSVTQPRRRRDAMNVRSGITEWVAWRPSYALLSLERSRA